MVVCVLPARNGSVVDVRKLAASLSFSSSEKLSEKEKSGAELNPRPPASSVRLATPAELVTDFGYPRGCMGPIGLRRGLGAYDVVFDESLFAPDAGSRPDVDERKFQREPQRDEREFEREFQTDEREFQTEFQTDERNGGTARRILAVGAGAAGVKVTGPADAFVEVTRGVVADISSPSRRSDE